MKKLKVRKLLEILLQRTHIFAVVHVKSQSHFVLYFLPNRGLIHTTSPQRLSPALHWQVGFLILKLACFFLLLLSLQGQYYHALGSDSLYALFIQILNTDILKLNLNSGNKLLWVLLVFVSFMRLCVTQVTIFLINSILRSFFNMAICFIQKCIWNMQLMCIYRNIVIMNLLR